MAETTLDGDVNALGGAAEPPQRWITRRRLAKWNRPAPPHDWRWAVSTLGRVLIATGVLLFGFVAYQLWGTGLETARAQRSLAAEFDELLATTPSPPGATPAPDAAPPDTDDTDDTDGTGTESDGADTGSDDGTGDGDGDTDTDSDGTGDTDTDTDSDGTGDTDTDTESDDTGDTDTESDSDGTGDTDTESDSDDTGDTDTDTDSDGSDPQPTAPPPPEADAGEPVAHIEIPAIGIDEIVVAGVRPNDLQKGPGHFPRTPFPGQLGNASVAGHRTTYGAPFRRVDQLQPGDEIVVTTVQGGFAYLVTGTEIVAPQDAHVVATTDPDVATLTLVSCHPVYSAAQRIIVTAEMDLTRSIPFPATIPADDTNDDTNEQPADLPSEDLAGGVGAESDDQTSDDETSDDSTGGTDDQTSDDETSDDGTGGTDDETSDESDDETSDDGTGDTDDETGDETGSPADEDPADDPADEDPADEPADDPADEDPADEPADDPAGIDAGSANGGTGAAAAVVASPAVDDELDEAFGRGWFHDRDAFGQIALWGALLAMVSIGAYLLSRATRRDLVGFAAGVAPFAIGAFFFFQNVNRLLPPGL